MSEANADLIGNTAGHKEHRDTTELTLTAAGHQDRGACLVHAHVLKAKPSEPYGKFPDLLAEVSSAA